MATIDAETSGRNILGDNGNAMGYGQVWPRWHADAFAYAAQKFRVDVPATLEGKQQLVLGNDGFSMAVAVFVIKKVWRSANQDFRQFSLQYVGPAIPDSDYQRRYNIWLKYAGKSVEATSLPPTVTTPGLDTTTAAWNAQYANVNIPTTNYGVVEGSQQRGDVLYGRRYRIIVSRPDGVALDVSQLRCTFQIQKTILQQPNFSEIVLYNLAPDTENSIIQEGNRIVVEAGYEGDQYGLIFDGDVVLAVRDKEDGVTYRLTLFSMDGDRFLNQGFVGFSVLKGQSARQIVDNVVNQAKIPAQLGSISEGFTSQELSRGKVIFGLAKDYLRQLAQSQEASFYVEDGKVNIVRMTDLPEGEITELSPESGLIGNPAQNDQGLTFKCLINPRIKINTLVRIDNSLIRAQAVQTGQPFRALDESGIYRVIKVTYSGDTRGDNWYCECEAVTQAGIIPSMMTSAGQNPY
ncbi:hypothetical protein D7M11_26015 [Paenibacillus ginsengarvi]|uniref:Uncharacterized protein n=2 Tax=Paenibacillus ginsengarvi TaxID=400777 RepID=A0A3B0BNQ5_9BACL|nr:hypothetical protein D7M11_26015 [Paenibacillus ginsengarvi]